jgi:ribosomal protein S18 acetylase RimI-like enzyme
LDKGGKIRPPPLWRAAGRLVERNPQIVTFRIRPARGNDYFIVIAMIEEAAKWLSGRGIDQWSEPWPHEEGRNERVRTGIEDGATWMITDGEREAATVTIYPEDRRSLWAGCVDAPRESAWYVHQLVVAREFEGRNLGRSILGWVSDRAHQAGVKWLRMDVWTTNKALHDYYRRQDFECLGPLPEDYLQSINLPGYPSSVLFHKETRPGDAANLTVDPSARSPGGPAWGSPNGAVR